MDSIAAIATQGHKFEPRPRDTIVTRHARHNTQIDKPLAKLPRNCVTRHTNCRSFTFQIVKSSCSSLSISIGEDPARASLFHYLQDMKPYHLALQENCLRQSSTSNQIPLLQRSQRKLYRSSIYRRFSCRNRVGLNYIANLSK